MGPYFDYVRTLGGREGAKILKFVRTPIVFQHFFFCLDSYREGGRVRKSHFFAYVIKVWPIWRDCMHRKRNNLNCFCTFDSCTHFVIVENV